MGDGFNVRRLARLVRPLVVVALASGAAAAWSQVDNPGFESGTLAPWTATFVGGNNGAGVVTSGGGVTPRTGSYFGRGFDNDGVGRLSQNITTAAGATYSVSVWVSTSGPVPPNTASIRLGEANTPLACTVGAVGVWVQCTGSFTVAGTSERLDLLFSTASSSGTLAFDDVTVTQTGGPAATVQAVPTLGEWTLLALGLAAGGLGLRRLRRQG